MVASLLINYGETRSLSVTTSAKEVKNRTLKHMDSLRSMQLSKSVDRSYVIGVDGKSRLPADLNESIRVLAKFKEAPWYFSEAREQPRSSKDLSPNSRELPRLSLDSTDGSLGSSNFNSKPNSISKDSDRSSINQGASNLQQEWGSYKHPTSVIAKLMGLEPLPHEDLASQKPVNLTETNTSKNNDPFNGQRNRNPIAKVSQATQDSRKHHLSHSPRAHSSILFHG